MSETPIRHFHCRDESCPSGVTIHAYLQDELEEGELTAVEASLSNCDGCRERLEKAKAGFAAMPAANRDAMLASRAGEWVVFRGP